MTTPVTVTALRAGASGARHIGLRCPKVDVGDVPVISAIESAVRHHNYKHYRFSVRGRAMTSHAQPIKTPPEPLASPTPFDGRHSTGIDENKHAGSGESVSVAKMGMISAIGTALVTAAATIIVTVGNSEDPGAEATAEPATATVASGLTTITPTLDQTSWQGTFDQVAINDSGTEVAVSGSARADVDSVVVMIGPRQSGGQFWANETKVVNQQWKLVVATEPHLPEPYTIRARYWVRDSGADAIQTASDLVSQRTTPTPPPPPGQLVNCAEQFGDSCFTGPGWGPPSVYQSDQ